MPSSCTMACTTTSRYCYFMHLLSTGTWAYITSLSSQHSQLIRPGPPLHCTVMACIKVSCFASKLSLLHFCHGASVMAEACSASDPYQLRNGTSSNSTAVTTSASCKLSPRTIRYGTYRFHYFCSPTRAHLIPTTMLYDIGTCVCR